MSCDAPQRWFLGLLLFLTSVNDLLWITYNFVIDKISSDIGLLEIEETCMQIAFQKLLLGMGLLRKRPFYTLKRVQNPYDVSSLPLIGSLIYSAPRDSSSV